jgi:DNA-binding response OmpR family regulator
MSEKCILVIEDQEDTADLYKATLKSVGYQVRIAYTGEEGIAEFVANGADAILLDMTLPEMQGIEVLKQIREVSANVPVIIVSGRPGDEVRRHCERLGVHEFLMKPPEYEALLSALERALSGPKEEYEIVTLRLPRRVIDSLTRIDSKIERAVEQLVDEIERRSIKAAK